MVSSLTALTNVVPSVTIPAVTLPNGLPSMTLPAVTLPNGVPSVTLPNVGLTTPTLPVALTTPTLPVALTTPTLPVALTTPTLPVALTTPTLPVALTTPALPLGRKKRSSTTDDKSAKKKLLRTNSASSNLGLKVIMDPVLFFHMQHEGRLSNDDYVGFKVYDDVNLPWQFGNGSVCLSFRSWCTTPTPTPRSRAKASPWERRSPPSLVWALNTPRGITIYVMVKLQNSRAISSSTEAVLDMSISRRGCLKKDEDPKVLKEDYNYTVYAEYDQTSCFLECRAGFFYEKCGCLPYFYPDFGKVWNKPTTCNAEGLKCLNKYKREL